MFFPLLFLCSIHLVISLSNQEDLSISNYSHIGCLILKSNKQFLVNNIQENSFVSYQTFSSSHMSIELCFRLCRRWIILTFNNQTNCICLYTINTFYQINRYLGELLSLKNCRSNHVQIYSLTKDISIFPSLINPDLSLDGCYHLHGLQTIRVDLWLNHVDYIQAIDLCEKSCQIISNTTSYSFFLSRQKACYCLPIKYYQISKTLALRKPIKYCSFISYICNTSCEKYSLEINPDTLIKVDVQHYCSAFLFDRILYSCLKLVLPREIDSDSYCLPLVIKTYEQWNYLIKSSWITYPKTFISIDRNSTYIFENLIPMKNKTLLSNDVCILINRNDLNKSVPFEFIQCDLIRSSGYNILCAQKPFETMNNYEEELKMINNESELPSDEILTCPPNFILFNKMCYSVHISFVYNIQNADRLCVNQYSNSSLVRFTSHVEGNINATKFLGRIFNDILLEFFYYQLEKKLTNDSINYLIQKNWLRLLLGNKNDPNECVLRYFIRLSGAFKTFYRCNNGGHPVCQCQPIRKKIQISLQSESVVPIATTQIIISNPTDSLIIPNEIICENCTTPIENLLHNESYNTTPIEIIITQSTNKHSKYRSLLILLSGPGLALLILLVGVAFLIRYLRQDHGSYSTNISVIGQHRRTKRSSTTLTTNDIPNTPAVLYTRLKPPRLTLTETDILNNFNLNEDHIELLPTTSQPISNNKTEGEEEELLNGIKYP